MIVVPQGDFHVETMEGTNNSRRTTKMAVTTMKALLEAGVHFGHQTKRWNPKMGKYIYATRNDIHIIDLQISVDHVEAAYQFVKSV